MCCDDRNSQDEIEFDLVPPNPYLYTFFMDEERGTQEMIAATADEIARIEAIKAERRRAAS